MLARLIEKKKKKKKGLKFFKGAQLQNKIYSKYKIKIGPTGGKASLGPYLGPSLNTAECN